MDVTSTEAAVSDTRWSRCVWFINASLGHQRTSVLLIVTDVPSAVLRAVKLSQVNLSQANHINDMYVSPESFS